MLNIPVVLGSVRESRRSIHPAKWMVEKLKAAGVETQLVDFKELPLPFFDSPIVPVGLKGKYPYPNVQKWSDIAVAADGFVIVTPEYNHGYPAIIKNALDWLFMEFKNKPFGFVGVSDGTFAGARSIEQLRTIIGNFSAFDIRDVIMFGKVQDIFDEQGKLLDESYNKRAQTFIKALLEVAEALKPIRPSLRNTK